MSKNKKKLILRPVDLRIEEHVNHARKKVTTVPVYRLKYVAKQAELGVKASNIRG